MIALTIIIVVHTWPCRCLRLPSYWNFANNTTKPANFTVIRYQQNTKLACDLNLARHAFIKYDLLGSNVCEEVTPKKEMRRQRREKMRQLLTRDSIITTYRYVSLKWKTSWLLSTPTVEHRPWWSYCTGAYPRHIIMSQMKGIYFFLDLGFPLCVVYDLDAEHVLRINHARRKIIMGGQGGRGGD